MKKLLMITVAFLLMAGIAVAANVDLEASWQQPDYDRTDRWAVFHSTVSGGPYTEIGTLTKAEAEADGVVKEFTIVSPDGQRVMHYFVVVAYDDDFGIWSGNSNQAEFEVDFSAVADPTNLTVIIKVTPQ